MYFIDRNLMHNIKSFIRLNFKRLGTKKLLLGLNKLIFISKNYSL